MLPLTVELETVTPLFLGGAEPRGSPPELRAASVRGALRYWLRALLGGVTGDDDAGIEAMREDEARVFGSTSQALGGASAIVLRLPPLSRDQIETIDVPAPRRGEIDRSYLFYGLERRRYKRNGQRRLEYRQSVRPDVVFPLKLSQRLGVQANEQYVQACASLWMLTHLGGLGARSRRGAGSVQVWKNPSSSWPSELLPPAIQSSTPAKLVDELKAGIQQVQQAVGQPVAQLSPPTRFDVLAPGAYKVWVLADSRPWSTWQQALDSIGKRMGDFRSYRPPDHDTMRKWMQGGKAPPTVERAIFGLPLTFRYSRGGPSDTVQGSQHDRRSSPLWLRLTKLTDGQQVGVATLFKSAFLAEGESLQLRRGRRTTAPPEDYSLIEEFIAGFPTCLEVEL